eukprot:361569-Chlamydomonas_euryale.AAC.8
MGSQHPRAPCDHQGHRVLRRQDAVVRRLSHHRCAADDGARGAAAVRPTRCGVGCGDRSGEA